MKNLTLLKLAAAIATVTTLGLSSACTDDATSEADRPAVTTYDTETYNDETTNDDLYNTDDADQGSPPAVTTTTDTFTPMGTYRETELHITGTPVDGVNADDLIGHNVMNRSTDRKVGEVTDIVLNSDGKVVAVVVSVGGELGVSQRSVAIGWDQVQRSVDGDELDLFVELDEDALESAPEYASN